MTSKIKVLLVGSVGDNIDVLQKKLQSLNSGKAGPFDVCFCVGPIQLDAAFLSSKSGDDEDEDAPSLPLPVYLQELNEDVSSSASSPAVSSSSSHPPGVVSLGTNLFLLKGDDNHDNHVKLFDITLDGKDSLVVGSCPRHVRSKGNTQQQPQKQCDLLFSSDWPQGMEDVLQVETEPLSYDVAEVALECRPRYHVCPSTRYFHASPPFHLPQSEHVGRFLALAPVIKEKPSKTTKFIHALGLEPLRSNPPPTTAPSTLPCPYLNPSGGGTGDNTTSQRRPLPNFVAQGSQGAVAYSRFAQGRKRPRNDGEGKDGEQTQQHSLEPPDDPTINTLFLYGLHKDVTGELQSTSSSKVLLAFGKYQVDKVRHPPNTPTSTYCFLEFPSQAKALECILDCQGKVTIDGVDLTLKWAQPKQPNRRDGGGNSNENKRHKNESHFVTQDEAKDSSTLYFHLPDALSKKFDEEEDSNVTEQFAERLRLFMQGTLEDALNDGVQDDSEGGGDEQSQRVTAETEPALRVQVRTKDEYGFLEFASHAAATMALAAATKSTDGGPVVVGELNGSSAFAGTMLRWAKGDPAVKKKGEREEVLEALGLKRQFFPADSRTDCWFCLASPTCETHLITGVYNEWYTAMPKGPVHPGHMLVIPVTHTSNGAWTMGDEWVRLVDKFQKHAAQAYDMDLFVFERSMQTRGGYHTHVQCVPVPKDSTSGKLQSTMLAHAKASGFVLRPIQSDLGVKALIEKDDSYFFAEVRRTNGSQTDRFLYRRDPEEDKAPSVPLQFAREVLASIFDNPKLAHWKACVVDKEKETELATDFRTSFSTTPQG